jgi:hypothetical protein
MRRAAIRPVKRVVNSTFPQYDSDLYAAADNEYTRELEKYADGLEKALDEANLAFQRDRCEELESRLAAAEERIKELEDALRPFAWPDVPVWPKKPHWRADDEILRARALLGLEVEP